MERPVDNKRQRLERKLRGEVGGAIAAALMDPGVVEVMLNPDGELWADRLGVGMSRIGSMSAPNAASFLGTVAASLETEINREKPILEGELLLDGSRFEGLMPPVVEGPAFSIRKRASVVFPLEDYVRKGALRAWELAALEDAVAVRRNILVAGGTGSGKTTFVNALLRTVTERAPQDRLVIIEDTAEIQCVAPNAVSMHTTDAVEMRELLRASMRLRPDRVVVGEVRGAEALTLLKAWNTGHPGGVCTVHANSARAALTRLENLVAEAAAAPFAPTLIGEAVDLVVALEERRVTGLLAVEGYLNGNYECRTLTEKRDGGLR